MNYRFLSLILICMCFVLSIYGASSAPSITAQDLLKPDVFPDAQLGMVVFSAEDGPIATVTTTGAVFLIDKAKGTIECKQRQFKIKTTIEMTPSNAIEYGDERSVAIIKLAKETISGIKLTSKTPGAAILTDNTTTIRINGDSLLMIQPGKGKDIKADIAFVPDYFVTNNGDHNFFDRYGGVSFFELGNSPKSALQVKKDPITVTWPWKPGDVFWVSVSPPKPYDWQASITHRIFIQESNEDRYVYPYDGNLLTMQRATGATVTYLYSNRLWEIQNGKIQCRNPAELERVTKSSHEYGLKVVLNLDMISLEDANSLYFTQIADIMKQYGFDGISIDGVEQLPRSLVTQYFAARTLRSTIGDSGLLYLHYVAAEPKGEVSIPTCSPVDSQFNIVWKDENYWNNTTPAYTRYELSTFNISNTMLLRGLSDKEALSPEMIDYWMRATNARFLIRERWFYNRWADVMKPHYLDRLNSYLRFNIQQDMIVRPIGAFENYRKALNSQ